MVACSNNKGSTETEEYIETSDSEIEGFFIEESSVEEFKSENNDALVRPGIVHRLDKGTSGLLVIAKVICVNIFNYSLLTSGFWVVTGTSFHIAIVMVILYKSFLWMIILVNLKFSSNFWWTPTFKRVQTGQHITLCFLVWFRIIIIIIISFRVWKNAFIPLIDSKYFFSPTVLSLNASRAPWVRRKYQPNLLNVHYTEIQFFFHWNLWLPGKIKPNPLKYTYIVKKY